MVCAAPARLRTASSVPSWGGGGMVAVEVPLNADSYRMNICCLGAVALNNPPRISCRFLRLLVRSHVPAFAKNWSPS
ncbi:MAG: hypothetical protein AAGL17_12780 [Cyanobacteria bacterium J06576_12]